MNHRTARRISVLTLALALAAAPARAGDRFVDSDEYKEGNYKTGCTITDYADMTEGDGVNWVWIEAGTKLGGPGAVQIAEVKNVSDVTDVDLAGKTKQTFEAALQRTGKTIGSGGLTFSPCIYWVERANTAKAFIPFAGGHLMQAGIGIEITVTDASGKTVAKIRHDGRNGQTPADAAGEVVDDIANFAAKN